MSVDGDEHTLDTLKNLYSQSVHNRAIMKLNANDSTPDNLLRSYTESYLLCLRILNDHIRNSHELKEIESYESRLYAINHQIHKISMMISQNYEVLSSQDQSAIDACCSEDGQCSLEDIHPCSLEDIDQYNVDYEHMLVVVNEKLAHLNDSRDKLNTMKNQITVAQYQIESWDNMLQFSIHKKIEKHILQTMTHINVTVRNTYISILDRLYRSSDMAKDFTFYDTQYKANDAKRLKYLQTGEKKR
jgi:hypothetical protein